MWRMYLNEDMSQKISHREDSGDKNASAMSAALPYLNHPDCFDFGKTMRLKFGYPPSMSNGSIKLPDNQYFIFGIPRISLQKGVPPDVLNLHRSCPDFSRASESNMINAAEEITELFRFVEHSELQTHANEEDCIERNGMQSDISNIDNIINNDVDKERLVTRSKVFWKKLAQRKQDIIELGKKDGRSVVSVQSQTQPEHIVSNDILIKQQHLLKHVKATPKGKSHKDMWKSLADKKTDILKMGKNSVENLKHKESRSSQFWNFIASKKNEILKIKRGQKNAAGSTPVAKPDTPNFFIVSNNDISKNKLDSLPKVYDFENSFQKELAERLRKRRQKESSTKE